jgi:hypothetical protein
MDYYGIYRSVNKVISWVDEMYWSIDLN